MRSYSISQFKAHALGILKGIAETGEGVVVTKRGKPLVRVVPHAEAAEAPMLGRLKGTVLHEADLTEPLGGQLRARGGEEGG